MRFECGLGYHPAGHGAADNHVRPITASSAKSQGVLDRSERKHLSSCFTRAPSTPSQPPKPHIVIEYRWAGTNEEQLPALAAELVRLKVDVIVTSTTPAAQAAKRATTTIPIVVTFVADPVGSGLVTSLARPDGNITGVTTLARGLVAKRLERLKLVVPRSTRVAVLQQRGALGELVMRDLVEETNAAGRTLGLQLHFVEIRRPEDLEHAFSAMRNARVEGILVFPNAMLFEARQRIVSEASKGRLPAVYPWREAASASRGPGRRISRSSSRRRSS